MKLLAIDTSTELATVALGVHGQLYAKEHGALRQHAQLLLPMIDALLKQAKMTIKDLDAIVFGRGPGSFTGLRIACSIAKGLAYAHNLPLYPVSSLASIAYEVYQQTPELDPQTIILAMMDARMQQLYWGCFSNRLMDAHEQVTEASVISLPENKPILLAGTGFESYYSDMSHSIQTRILERRVIVPHAKAMIEIVESGLVNSVNSASAVPIYIRNQVTHGESNG